MRAVLVSNILVSVTLLVACQRDPVRSHHSTPKAVAASPQLADDDKSRPRDKKALPEENYASTGITRRGAPSRLLVRKAVWRGGPEVLVVEASDPRVKQLHDLLAENQRVEYLCGYHWAFDFEYASGFVETILINENCESFRHNGKETWDLLSTFFRIASKKPTHHLVQVVVRDPAAKSAVEQELEKRYGPAFNTERGGPILLLASRAPWSAEKVKELQLSSARIARVEQIPVHRYQ